MEQESQSADQSIARSGETQRQADWRDELLKTGVRGKAGQRIVFSRVEPLPGTRWLHVDAETKEDKPQRVVVSFGPEYAPLEQRQVELALGEAETLRPKPKIVVFAAFQFDPEAAKDIDETKWPGVTLLKAQMNADLLTEDLKKKRASNESFWLIGQPDVELEKIGTGEHKGAYRVTVNGFDYYNTKTGTIESGGTDRIAMWMLDPDYDGRSLFPRQVFFLADVLRDGLKRLAKNLKAEIDHELVQNYLGTVSLPFKSGDQKRTAVKIVDDRGIESFRVISL
jgi:adenine-specific DNA-methyltransferase